MQHCFIKHDIVNSLHKRGTDITEIDLEIIT